MKRRALELRLALADRARMVVAILFIAAALAALANGMHWRTARAAAVDAERLRGAEEVETVRRELKEIEARTLAIADASLATRFIGRLNHRAVLPPTPLSAAAIGMADAQPFAAPVSVYSVAHGLLDKHQLEDPLALLAGRFDLAFVIVYFLPLLIIVLTYDVLSSERERGTLALAVLQSGSVARVLRAKLGARLAIVATLLAVPLIVLAFIAPALEVALWGAIVIAYAAFWLALAVAVNLLRGSSAINATALCGVWVVLLLVVPAVLSLCATRLHPLPSRLEALAAIRRVNLETAESGERLLTQFLQEHPDLAAEQSESGGGQYIAIRQAQERNVSPLLRAFDEQLARQHALIGRYALLSPAIVTDDVLLEIAGTGRTRHERYEAQLRTFLDRWRAHFVRRAFRGGSVTVDELNAMPQFRFDEAPAGTLVRAALRAVLLIAAPLLLVVAFSTSRLRRSSPRP
jgi:ABC-2 type transport system permease protein